MRWLRTLVFALFVLPCASATPPNAPDSQAVVFPTVTAYALDRAKVTLPADFATPLNVLILSFQRDQQSVVEGWIPALPPGDKAQTWVLPISGRESGLYRWWLNASLRGNLPPSLSRRYWVPLYVNKQQFLHSLQVSSEKDVVLLLTDKTGHVLWRATGPVNDTKKAALNNLVSKATSH